MPEPNVTSADQLDALLEEAKISREEYETLREAMDATAAEEAARRRRSLPPSPELRICRDDAPSFGRPPL